ncbi:MAG: hypothetical protein HZA91_19565 [Verrucomicrobia bacterium]|nr:hypothetical protein [Verrucomicrobiota bacterium]
MKRYLIRAAVALTTAAAVLFALDAGAAAGKPKAKRTPKPVFQASGEVVTVGEDFITVKTAEGADMKFLVIPGTRMGDKELSSYKPADKVVVHYKEDGSNKVATKIDPPGAAKKGGGKKK